MVEVFLGGEGVVLVLVRFGFFGGCDADEV